MEIYLSRKMELEPFFNKERKIDKFIKEFQEEICKSEERILSAICKKYHLNSNEEIKERCKKCYELYSNDFFIYMDNHPIVKVEFKTLENKVIVHFIDLIGDLFGTYSSSLKISDRLWEGGIGGEK